MAGKNKKIEVKLKGDILSFPVKSGQLIYRGQNVMVDSTGFALPANDTGSCFFVGVSETANTAAEASSSGAVNVKVRRSGTFKMKLESTGDAAPTLVGSLVYQAVKHDASTDGLVDIAGDVDNHLLIGQVVKHGTTKAAIAGDNSTEVWVNIIALKDTAAAATYTTISSLVAYVDGTAGEDLIGIGNKAAKWPASFTLADFIDEFMASGQISIGIGQMMEDDGTALTNTSDATIGYKQLGTEEVILQVAAAEVFGFTIGLPEDFDGAADATLDLIVVKNGTDADNATMNLEAYAVATGAAVNSAVDAYAGSAIAIVDNENVQILSFTLLAASMPDLARSLSILFTPAGSDEIYVLGATLKYARQYL